MPAVPCAGERAVSLGTHKLMNMCMHMHIHACIHITHAPTYTHVQGTHTCTHIHTGTHTCMHTHRRTHIPTHIHTQSWALWQTSAALMWEAAVCHGDGRDLIREDEGPPMGDYLKQKQASSSELTGDGTQPAPAPRPLTSGVHAKIPQEERKMLNGRWTRGRRKEGRSEGRPDAVCRPSSVLGVSSF